MFCNFCGKNFDSSEGSEDVNRHGHHLIRCEKCSDDEREEEYDWHEDGRGGGHERKH